MSNVIHTVELIFAEDENGEYGLLHKGSEEVFNSFWNAIGIFHDVFEHYFEGNKYFRGDAEFNRCGEIAASGAAYYYWYDLNIWSRWSNPYTRGASFSAFEDANTKTNFDPIQERIDYDSYMSFDNTFECNVPLIKKARLYNDEIIDIQADKLFNSIKTLHPKSKKDKDYFKTITKSKIRRLYRWGYHQASKILPDTWYNRETYNNFIHLWHDFTKKHNAEELYNEFKGIRFEISKIPKTKDRSWKAFLIPQESYWFDDYELNEDNIDYFSLEDYYLENQENYD